MLPHSFFTMRRRVPHFSCDDAHADRTGTHAQRHFCEIACNHGGVLHAAATMHVRPALARMSTGTAGRPKPDRDSKAQKSPSAKKCILGARVQGGKKYIFSFSHFGIRGEKKNTKKKVRGGSFFATTPSPLDLIHFPCFPCSWGNLGSQETPVV